MRQVQVAGRDLVQHGRKEEEVLAVDEGHLDIQVTGQGLLQLQRRVEAAKSTAQDQDPLEGRR